MDTLTEWANRPLPDDFGNAYTHNARWQEMRDETSPIYKIVESPTEEEAA